MLDFLLHVVSTCDLSEILGIDHSRVLPFETVLASGARRTHAVLAVELAAAGRVSRVGSQVGLAGVVRDAFLECEFVHVRRLAAVAAVVRAEAVHDHLGREGPVLQVVGQDVGAVREGRGGALRPARPAVLRDVLLFGPGQLVHSVDVTPEVGGREFEFIISC